MSHASTPSHTSHDHRDLGLCLPRRLRGRPRRPLRRAVRLVRRGAGRGALGPLPGFDFHLHEPSAAYWQAWLDEVACLVVGRRLFDIAGGWGGRHPLGCPVVCVSHSVPDGWPREDAPTEFVADVAAGVERAREIAGDGTVGVAAGQVGRQALDLGLVDEVLLDLVPVVLGRGIPYFGALENGPVRFGDPEITAAPGVTHLRFRRV